MTWEADTTGTINNDNGHGLIFYITLQVGSDRTSGSIPSTWETLATADIADSSQTQFFDSTSRTLFITGLQMEVGSVATPFEHRSFGEEESLCRRYYYQTVGSYYSGQDTSGASRNWFTFTARMRANPSITNPSVSGGTIATITTNQDAHTYEVSANRPGLALTSPFKADAEL